MEFVRIGRKIVNRRKIISLVKEMLKKRSKGATQAEVASSFGVERAFVSYLEGLGEVRRGKSVAIFGFNIENKKEVEQIAGECGVDYTYLTQGKDLPNSQETLSLLTRLKDFDVVVGINGGKENRAVEKILGREIISVPISQNSSASEKQVALAELKKALVSLTSYDEVGEYLEKSDKRKLRLFKKRS